MVAEIITIGDEILIGQIVDTNSAWLGRTLGDAGIRIGRIVSVSDNAQEIEQAVHHALKRAELVLTTGGLGPTKDDITKHTLANMFSMKLVRNEEAFRWVKEMIEARGLVFNELNQSQALLPDGCTMLPNRNGTAPGMWFDCDGKVLVSLPGVPFEMKELIQNEVLPRLRTHFTLPRNLHKTAITFGLAESMLAETIASWEAALPSHLHLAYLPSALGIRLRLSVYETEDPRATTEIDEQFARLETLIPDYIIGYGETSLEEATGTLLLQHQESVATAESCTGGNIAHRFTAHAGASAYFRGGVVAYANEVKTAVLGVDPQALAREGAVSRIVAEQMAEGVRRATGATYGLSTTGVAGPDGGTPEKPVGTVWMALATPQGVYAYQRRFSSLRSENIQRASSFTLNLLRLYLKGLLKPE